MILILPCSVLLAALCPNCKGCLEPQAGVQNSYYCVNCKQGYREDEVLASVEQGSEDSGSEEETCAICFEEKVKQIDYPCCQYKSCIKCARAVAQNGQKQCPQCRTGLDSVLVQRMFCPLTECPFSTATRPVMNEHLLGHSGILYTATPAPRYESMISQNYIFCSVCKSAIACVSTAESPEAALTDHIAELHQIFYCNLCQQQCALNGRQGLAEHLRIFHCRLGCHFSRCDYLLTEQDLQIHVLESHKSFSQFWEILSSYVDVSPEDDSSVTVHTEAQSEGLSTPLSSVSELQEPLEIPEEPESAESPVVLPHEIPNVECPLHFSVEETGSAGHCISISCLTIDGSCMILNQNRSVLSEMF